MTLSLTTQTILALILLSLVVYAGWEAWKDRDQ